jgi:ubiquitin carboxyl-terminal hydrolase 5/13
MSANSSARQSEIKAWEEEITACEHTLCLEQVPPKEVKSAGASCCASLATSRCVPRLISMRRVSLSCHAGATCSQCELGENLWLCLTCGSLGCGRPQFGGGGGNGHGLAHFDQTAHPVALKLGTITPEGTADIYCYSCNDARLDLELKAHCATFGIHLASQTKTEKSMTELQLEQNIKFDFSMTGDDGRELQPLFGPGLTGLKNLGNRCDCNRLSSVGRSRADDTLPDPSTLSCYLASTIQSLFSLPAFQQAYYSAEKSHTATCSLPPDSCFTCQLRKVADGLLSGRYSQPSKVSKEAWQDGLKPNMLKELIGKGHEEFASMRQQGASTEASAAAALASADHRLRSLGLDAEEFFQHFLKTLRVDAQKQRSILPGSGLEPTDVFRFGLEQRLQCTSCLGVRYRTDEQDSVSVPVAAVEKGKDADGKVLYESVRLEDCIEQALEPTELEYNCPSCKKTVTAVKSVPFLLATSSQKLTVLSWIACLGSRALRPSPTFSLSTLRSFSSSTGCLRSSVSRVVVRHPNLRLADL